MNRSPKSLLLAGINATVAGMGLANAAVPGAYGTITFDLFTDSTTTSGSVGTNWKVGSVANEGTLPAIEIGFTLSSVTPNGGSSTVPSGFGGAAGKTGGFCVEIAQNVNVPASGLTYEWVPLNRLDYYSAPGSGSNAATSFGIDNGGIGVAKAVLVSILFDQAYAGIAPAGSSTTTVQQNRSAFQLALWKLTHQKIATTVAAANWSLNYTGTTGANDTFGYITSPAAGAETTILNQATTYVNAVIAQYNLSGNSYNPTTKLIALESSTGQDLIAVSNNSAYFSAVPEPSTWAAIGFLGLAVGGTAWRRRKA